MKASLLLIRSTPARSRPERWRVTRREMKLTLHADNSGQTIPGWGQMQVWWVFQIQILYFFTQIHLQIRPILLQKHFVTGTIYLGTLDICMYLIKLQNRIQFITYNYYYSTLLSLTRTTNKAIFVTHAMRQNTMFNYLLWPQTYMDICRYVLWRIIMKWYYWTERANNRISRANNGII